MFMFWFCSYTGIYTNIFANNDHMIFKKVTQADEELYVYKDLGDAADTPHVANMWVQSIRNTKKKKDRLRIKNNFDN